MFLDFFDSEQYCRPSLALINPGDNRNDSNRNSNSYLSLLFWKLHIIKDPEYDVEQVLEAMRLEKRTIRFHDFKHDSKSSKIRINTN